MTDLERVQDWQKKRGWNFKSDFQTQYSNWFTAILSVPEEGQIRLVFRRGKEISGNLSRIEKKYSTGNSGPVPITT